MSASAPAEGTSGAPQDDTSRYAGAGGGENNQGPAATDTNGMFECNICFDAATDPVVSLCGHLFCWPCLHQWLETRPERQICPVCKAAISKDKVVPLYGRGSKQQQDPREKLPPRPAGQRTEPEHNRAGSGFGVFDSGFQMSFGIGAFPFGIFASTFNLNDGRPPPPQRGTPQYEEDQFLSKVFLWMAIFFAIWLLIA